MQHFTPAQWVLIDAANTYGLDKETYEDRLKFGRELLEKVKAEEDLSAMTKEADTPPLFVKSLYAIEDILAGNPTSHIIELDAVNSGPQLLSVLLHCKTGMRNSGVINTGVRPDGYNIILDNMNQFTREQTEDVEDTAISNPNAKVIVREDGGAIERKEVKNAAVPYAYGSDHKPIQVFGQDVFHVFEEGYARTFPLAAWIRQVLINAWDSSALYHEFESIDGFVSHLECRGTVSTKSTIQGYTYTYIQEENRPLVPGFDQGTKSLVANVTHSGDAFLVREMKARCQHSPSKMARIVKQLEDYLRDPESQSKSTPANLRLHKLAALSERHNFVSAAMFDHIEGSCLRHLGKTLLGKLLTLAKRMLERGAFYMITIHDAFKCSPMNAEAMRMTYNEIIAELYESPWLLNVVEDLTGVKYEWVEECDDETRDAILDSDYMIC